MRLCNSKFHRVLPFATKSERGDARNRPRWYRVSFASVKVATGPRLARGLTPRENPVLEMRCHPFGLRHASTAVGSADGESRDALALPGKETAAIPPYAGAARDGDAL